MKKPRCIACRVKQVSQHLIDRYHVGLFCSLRCATDHAHATAKHYLACPHCGQQNVSDDFFQAPQSEIQCPECGQSFPEKAAG